jgi:hypothetical protein
MYVIGEKDEVTQGQREWDKDSLFGTRKTFSVVYYVRATSKAENEDDALAATGLPPIGILRNRAYLKQKAARESSASALLWEVECYFDSHVDPKRPVVKWGWTAESIELVITHDPVTGAPIVNAVGEPIIVTAPFVIPILWIERMEASFSPDTILAYCNRTNSQPFWGAPPKAALMGPITDSPEEVNGVTIRRVRYEIKFNLLVDPDTKKIKGWISQPLNEGTKYRDKAGDKTFIKFREKFKDIITGNLNLDGTARDPTQPAVYLNFHRHPLADLNNLELGPWG